MTHPLLYEINTRCWLRELSVRHSRSITLAEVPDSEFLFWQRSGFTHLWLMGVWTGGPRARRQALASDEQRRAYFEALPDWTEDDVVASPYAISAYKVPAALGGNVGLESFRRKLHSFGLKLVLDFVPNHLGLDHPWIQTRPDLFVQATSPAQGTFVEETTVGKRRLAHGKDPNWSGWTDTVQIEYRRREARSAMTELLAEVAELCDGVRCDMAMLLLSEVFSTTWRDFPIPFTPAAGEFWTEATAEIRRRRPEFLFLAEVYWGLEARLQQLGFDYTYDKVLYDKLVSRETSAVQSHLLGMSKPCLAAGAHFLENHDERRIASTLSAEENRAAALVILGLPGMRFLHEGQLSGARRKLPVQLARRARETPNPEIETLYDQLLAAIRGSSVGRGQPELIAPRLSWTNNPTAENFVLVQWRLTNTDFDLVVVNLAPYRSQCFAPLRLPQNTTHSWLVCDRLSENKFVRQGDDLSKRGLYLDAAAHGTELLHFQPAVTQAPT